MSYNRRRESRHSRYCPCEHLRSHNNNNDVVTFSSMLHILDTYRYFLTVQEEEKATQACRS